MQAEVEARMAAAGFVPAGERCLELVLSGVETREADARPLLVTDLRGHPYVVELQRETFAPTWAVDIATRLARAPGTDEEGRDVVLAEAVVSPTVREALLRDRSLSALMHAYVTLTT